MYASEFAIFTAAASCSITRENLSKGFPMGDSSQFSPLTTLSEQLGPNSWVSSVFIPSFIANIGKHFFLKYDSEYSKSI